MRNKGSVWVLVLLIALLCAVGALAEEKQLSDFQTARIGIQTGSADDFAAKQTFPDAEFVNFSSVSDEALALENGKIDAFCSGHIVAGKLCRQYPGFYIVDGALSSGNTGFAFDKTPKGKALMMEMNVFLAAARADGLLDALEQKWIFGDESGQTVPDPAQMSGEKGTIRVAAELLYDPFAFVKDGKPCGFDIDLLYQFGIACGYRIEIVDMSFDAELVSVTTGNCDIAASGIAITDERRESVYFSDPYYHSNVVLLAKMETTEGKRATLADSFYKTFVRENRWQMIVSGIGTTLLITFCSAMLGTLIGFALCMLKRGSRIGAVPVNVFIKLLQGTPIVVILMMFYYVIFGRSGLPAVPVAIIAFALNFSAYCAEIMRTGIDAVDAGQREAALALGYSEREAFFYYIFPQAAQHFLPVYRGEIVSLLKNTSVVGFITIMDLTKAGDIIRSRTYEAFFPLIAVALIYFAISYVLAQLVRRVEICVTPNRKNRSIKGVRMHD